MPPSAISVVVCDTGPLIALGRLDRLGLLIILFHDVPVPQALLADDLAARHYAHGVGLTVIGTLGVLVRAKRKGEVAAIRPLIDQLRASGQRLGQAAVAEALAAAGE